MYKRQFLPLLTRVRKNCQLVLPASDNSVTANLLRIMQIMTEQQEQFKERMVEEDAKPKPDTLTQRLDMIFQFALMWSLGAIVDDASIRTYTTMQREMISEIFKIDGKQVRIERQFQIPDGGLAPTNYYVDDKNLWQSWKNVLNRQEGRF